jgi:hypothetical protein
MKKFARVVAGAAVVAGIAVAVGLAGSGAAQADEGTVTVNIVAGAYK